MSQLLPFLKRCTASVSKRYWVYLLIVYSLVVFVFQQRKQINIGTIESTGNIGDVLCVKGDYNGAKFYGDNSNRILTLSNALAILAGYENSATNSTDTPKESWIGLEKEWSEWYEATADAHDKIILHYNGPCGTTWNPEDLFWHPVYKMSDQSIQQLKYLAPKSMYRKAAERALAKYSQRGRYQVITVHRRNLEGGCAKHFAIHKQISCVDPNASAGITTDELVEICNLDYTTWQNKHQQLYNTNIVPTSVTVLCTDGQRPEFDETFPIISSGGFHTELWLMILSDVHYGSPMSSVDYVVSAWRASLNPNTTSWTTVLPHPHVCYEQPATPT
jgi:hypothetical protein